MLSKSVAIKYVLLAVFAVSIAAPLLKPDIALAAGEKYVWSGSNINGSQGSFDAINANPKTVTFNFGALQPAGGPFVYRGTQGFITGGKGGSCRAEWEIRVASSDTTKGTIKKISTGSCGQNLSGTVNITGTAPPGIGGGSTGGGGEGSEEDLCSSPTGELGWVICPMSTFVMDGAIAIDDFIIDHFLKLDTASIFGGPEQGDQESSGGYRTAHGAFRNIAYALLVLLGLIMVVSQIIGLDVFDAYTIRKMLPKMVLAAIILPLLWPLLAFLFNMANDSADAVQQIIRAPFANIGREFGANDVLGAVGAVGVVLAAAGGVAALLAFGGAALSIILPVVGMLLLAVASAFLVLAIRDIVAGGIVIISPVVAVMSVFGPTYPAAKLIRRMGTTILISIPAVAGMLMLSKVGAVLALLGKGGWGVIIAWVFIGAGYALLWKTVKRIDQVSGQIDGAVNSATSGGRKWLANKRQKAVAESGAQVGSKVIQKRAKWYQQLKDKSDLAGGKGRGGRAKIFRGLAGVVSGRNIEAVASAARAAASKEANDQIATGRDEERRGLTVDRRLLQDFEGAQARGEARMHEGKRQYKSLGGAWVNESDVIAGHERWKGDVHAQQASLSYEMRKASTEEELDHIAKNYKAVTESWGMSDIDAGGAWIGAAFENQNAHLQFKSTDWRTGQLSNPGRLVDEIYERRGSYNVAQMASATIESLKKAYIDAEITAEDIEQDTAEGTDRRQREKTDRRQKIAAIAETFMYEGGQQVGHMEGDQPMPAPMVPVVPTTTVGTPAPAAPTTTAPPAPGTTIAPTTTPATAPAGTAITTATPGTAPPTTTAPPTIVPRIASAQGAGHVRERVLELAALTGVAWQGPSGQYFVGGQLQGTGTLGPTMPTVDANGNPILTHGESPTQRGQSRMPVPPGGPTPLP